MVEKEIQMIADTIGAKYEPKSIVLTSKKINNLNELISFKIALIVSDDISSISELECKIYIDVDSEIPYDIVIYRASEWLYLKEDTTTFAYKIYSQGVWLYGERLS
ncbi:MAG: hypothetical protein LUG94_01490 [Ruminococcus sp.]|nr:hypothetical protein [Ruminococcus sp.]